MGWPEGSPEGWPDGSPVGWPDGSPVGWPEGSPVGWPEGSPEGSPVGWPEGSPVGWPEGSPVGWPEGSPEGSPVGWPEGSPVGSPVGWLEGSPEGWPEGSPLGTIAAEPKVIMLTMSSKKRNFKKYIARNQSKSNEVRNQWARPIMFMMRPHRTFSCTIMCRSKWKKRHKQNVVEIIEIEIDCNTTPRCACALWAMHGGRNRFLFSHHAKAPKVRWVCVNEKASTSVAVDNRHNRGVVQFHGIPLEGLAQSKEAITSTRSWNHPTTPFSKLNKSHQVPLKSKNKQVVWYKSKSSLCQFHFQSTWSLASHDSSTWTYTYLSMPLLSLCESWSCSGVVGSLSIWRWILLWGICFRTRAHIYWLHPFQCHKGIARCNV